MIAAIALTFLASLGAGFSGQASGWAGASYDTAWLAQAGLRYVPTLDLKLPLGERAGLDCELALNGYADARARADSLTLAAKLKPYRAWLRLFGQRYEARAGLQKINFGSATLLRPLQWFDRLDPRDPLGMTDGVYGLLGRYYFQNNANLWAWGLIGNTEPKGWEYVGSEKWAPEFGGRAQVPVPRGEVAATYHRRTELLPTPVSDGAEDRFGLDGKWDIGVGACLEAVLTRYHTMVFGVPGIGWTRFATLGLDYTFGFGAGFGVVAEHMVASTADDAFGRGDGRHVTALMASYPVTLLDNVRVLALYDWSGKKLYPYAAWQRTLDNWIFQVAGFWGPSEAIALGGAAGMGAGKGVSVLVAYNH